MKCLVIIFFFSVCTYAESAEMSFDDAFKKMLGRNTDIPSANATLDAASITNISSKMLFLPTIILEKSKTQYYQNELKRDGLTLTSTLNLFHFGADVFKATAAGHNEHAYSWNTKLVELNTEYDVAQILLDYISKGLSLNAFKEYAKVKRQAFKVAQLRTQRGLLSIQESQKAEVDLNNAESQLQNNELSFIAAKSRLASALGSSEVKIDWPWLNFIEMEKHSAIVSSKFNVEKSPQYKKSQSELEVATNNLKSAKSSILPSLDVSYSYSSVDEVGNKFHEQVGFIKLSMSIFNGLTDYAHIAEQRALAIVSQNNLEKTIRDLTAIWDERSSDLIISSKNAIKSQHVLRLARKLYDDSFKRFEQGRSSVNDLLLDQSRLLDSETLAINSWYNAHLALIGVCSLKGLSIFECLHNLY